MHHGTFKKLISKLYKKKSEQIIITKNYRNDNNKKTPQKQKTPQNKNQNNPKLKPNKKSHHHHQPKTKQKNLNKKPHQKIKVSVQLASFQTSKVNTETLVSWNTFLGISVALPVLGIEVSDKALEDCNFLLCKLSKQLSHFQLLTSTQEQITVLRWCYCFIITLEMEPQLQGEAGSRI